MKTRQTEIKAFIKAYGTFRSRFTKPGRDWGNVVRGELQRGGISRFWKDEKPADWGKWADTKRWRIYEDLIEDDFPECIPHLRAMLSQSCFQTWRLHFFYFGAPERRAAKKLLGMLDSIEALI